MHVLRHVGAAVLVLLLMGGAGAAEIATSLAGHMGEGIPATLRARRIHGNGDPVVQPTVVPGAATLALGEGLWEVTLAGDGLWARMVYVRGEDAAAMPVWRTVPLRGKASGATGIRAEFTPLEANGAAGETACTVDGETWTCSVPEGRYDLRFVTPGAAAEHRFGVDVASAGEIRLQFVRGASLSGKIAAPRASLEGTNVTLTSAAGQRLTTRADAKGFFQFKGVAPGDYTVSATKAGMVARPQAVKILAERAALLNEPLLLDAPKRLTVHVAPPLDPEGERWRVRLIAVDERARRADVITESSASERGEWTSGGVIAGEYTVEIRRGDDLWTSQEVTLDSDATIDVVASALRVRGTVTLAGEPLEATLTFGGEGGAQLRSDARGEVAGEIPPDDDGARLVVVESETPRVRRTVKTTIDDEGRFTIELPGTTLMGRVLNEDRTPAARAYVAVTRDHPDVFEQTFTEDDGSFQIAGFEPGEYRITAEGFEQASQPLLAELRENEPNEVELVLQRQERVRGRMTFGEVPVIQAEVYALPRDAWAPTIPRARTNEHGAFLLDLPPSTRSYDGIAVHPAFDIVIARGTVQRDRPVRIRTQQLGGTLVARSKTPEQLVLVHNGAEVQAGWLAQLARGTSDGGSITIPRLEPGQYSVCRTPERKCASGYLAPHGTLTLAID